MSPRMGRKAGEPTYTSKLGFETLAGTRIEDGTMILHARCSDCHVWPNGFLNTTSPDQPMIYAFGAAYELQSSSPSADLKRHVHYGQFTMDMVSATGTGGIPLKSSAIDSVRLQSSVTTDVDRKNLAHAILGCLVLFLAWPLNVFIVGFLRNISIHFGLSIAMVVCLGVVYGLGISASDQYNRVSLLPSSYFESQLRLMHNQSKAFSTPHQILSFTSLVPLVLLSILPIRPLTRFHCFIPRLHALLSSLTLTLLLIAGGLGFYLSQQSHPIVLIYTALSLILVVFLAIMSSIVRRRRSAYTRAIQRFSLPPTSPSELGLLTKETRTGSATSVAESATSLKRFLDESRQDGGKGKPFGGGTMPGPHYLLNMHPGVPVHIGSRQRI